MRQNGHANRLASLGIDIYMKDLLSVEFEKNVPIQNLCTFKTTGKISGVFYPKNKTELKIVLNFLQKNPLDYFFIGTGSNLLISPKTQKIGISFKKMKSKMKINGDIVEFSASVMLAKAFAFCKNASLSGLEELASIPATIAGAIKNNASCFGKSIFDHLVEVKILKNGRSKVIKKKDIVYCYHKTSIEGCILSAKFKFLKDNPCKIEQRFLQGLKMRKEKQPTGFSAGSVFRNPEGKSAGAMIDELGLKGKRCGNAIISQKHGNFIINEGGASFDNVITLVDMCSDEMLLRYGIPIEREIEIIE